jgi:hypothetical protein
MVVPKSSAMISYAGMMAAAVKVDIQACQATSTRLAIFCTFVNVV